MKFKDIKIGQRYFIDYPCSILQKNDSNSFTGYGVVVGKNPLNYPRNCIEVKLEGLGEKMSEGYFDAEDIKYYAPNLLAKIKIYLVGAVESEKDCGASWRNEIKNKLKDLNIYWFDPLNKIFVKDADESSKAQIDLKKLRADGKFDNLAKRMKKIRSYDLSMVDRSDAVIFHFDIQQFTCGSWEELTHANSLKRPVFFICKQGVKNVPLWMFGMLPYKYFYNNIDEVVEVIKDIDNGNKTLDSDRWRLLRKDMR